MSPEINYCTGGGPKTFSRYLELSIGAAIIGSAFINPTALHSAAAPDRLEQGEILSLASTERDRPKVSEVAMETDDELKKFEAQGAKPLPVTNDQGYVDHEGARIWYATYGSGAPVVLLHGGLGNGRNWGYQIPAVVEAGYRAVVIDTRGHGRSTHDARPYTYALLAADILAVMDDLRLKKAAIVGWSDGASTGLVLAKKTPERVAGVFFFVCNVDPSGTKPFEMTPTIGRCFARHRKDYLELSSTPDQFDAFVEAVGQMQKSDHRFTAADLAEISVPVSIVQSEHDEFIKREHAEYLARTIPGAELIVLPGVSHFAPLQRPELFNRVIQAFLEKVGRADTQWKAPQNVVKS